MGQVFGRSANTISRASIAAIVIGLAGIFVALFLFVRSSYVTGVGLAPQQPVQFSHKHHVGDDGIDCRYCHTTVETSAFAGIPPHGDVHELPQPDLVEQPRAPARAR